MADGHLGRRGFGGGGLGGRCRSRRRFAALAPIRVPRTESLSGRAPEEAGRWCAVLCLVPGPILRGPRARVPLPSRLPGRLRRLRGVGAGAGRRDRSGRGPLARFVGASPGPRGTRLASRRGERVLADLFGALVLSQTLEGWMAELSVPSPLGELELRHVPRRHPVRVTHPGSVLDRRLG